MLRHFLVLLLILGSGSLFPLTIHAQDEVQATVEKYQDLSDQLKIFSMVVDKSNAKWLATDQGLYKITSIRTQPELIDDSRHYVALAKTTDGEVWAATIDNEIVDPNQNVVYEFGELDMKITCMTFNRSMLYIGTNQGVMTFNTKLGKTSKSLQKNNSRLPNDQINMIMLDSKDQLWIGTDEGLAKMRKGKIRDVYEKKHKFWAATETKEGIWVVSNQEMWLLDFLESDRYERWRPAALRRGLSEGQVRALTSDSKGRLYLASETLVQFDPYNDQTTLIDKNYGFVSSDALALTCNRNDDLWVGTGDQGLFRVDILEGEIDELTAVAYVHEEIPCHGRRSGEVRLKVNGGKKPYTIQWNTNTGNLNETELPNLPAGTYSATITDADRIEYVAATNLTEPDAINIEEVRNQRTSSLGARDGELDIAVSGGTEPYTLRWSNGRRNTSSLTNLKYGEYTLTVVDENRCEAEKTFFINKPKVLPQLDVATVEVGQTLRIEQLFFQADSTEVEPESYPVLDEIYDFLEANPNIIVEIGGHTNSRPPEEYCDRLSTARAKNVAEYLYDRGLTSEQIIYKGYGKRNPIATNRTRVGRQKNQRVELKIIDIRRG